MIECDKCNLNCPHCYRSDQQTMDKPIEQMQAKWKNEVDANRTMIYDADQLEKDLPELIQGTKVLLKELKRH